MQVPDKLAGDIVNVTATGQSYISFNFKNVTTTDTFQVGAFSTFHLLLIITNACTVCGSIEGLQQVLANSCRLLVPITQAQIAATGVVTLTHNLNNLVMYASTNASAVLDGKLNNVYLNYASTQPVILTNAQTVCFDRDYASGPCVAD